jgi:hypothetical protein
MNQPNVRELQVWPDPQPLPTGLPPVEAFDPVLLPDVLAVWIDDIATRMQCPADFPAVAGVLSLSALVGRRISIFPKQHDDWCVVPNLWGAVIGRPGLMKTPAIAEPKFMLDRLEHAAKLDFEDAMRDYQAKQMVNKAAQKQTEQDIAKALKAKCDAHMIAMQAVMDTDTAEPQRTRYITNDATVEKLGELLAANPYGVMVFRDELTGFLRSLEKEGREGSRAFYLEAWNGNGRYTFDRIGRGTVDIPAACVSILGGIQPGPLGSYLSAATLGGAGDDGLMQRFQLMVWPDVPKHWENFDRRPDSEARAAVAAIFERIATLDPRHVGANLLEGRIPALRFAPDAQDRFNHWRHELEHRLRSDELTPVMEAHLSKYRSLVPSLALLFHLVDSPDGGPVPLSQLERAIAWALYLESHAHRIYAQAQHPDMAAAIELSRRIKQGALGGQFTARDVYRKHWRLLDAGYVNKAIEVLSDHDHLAIEDVPAAESGGRPSRICHVNPKLWSESS